MLNGYKAVFFDVGGTLLKVHPSVGAVYASHARDFGFTGDPDDLDRQFLVEWKNMGGMEGLGRGQGPEVERAFWSDIVRRTFAPFWNIPNFDPFFEHLYQGFVGRDHWHVFKDVTESRILERLKERGIVLGVVSNWDSRLQQILDNVGLARYFDFILASTVVGSAKPDTGIFEAALTRSGVAPHEACHIGDEPGADLKGAHDSGIQAILIDRDNRHDHHTPKIASFQELL